jgi:L-2,4-diaminobutyrate decarboxylase
VHASTDLRPDLHRLDPFASPDQADPVLRDFLHRASDLLCDWIGTASKGVPLPTVRPQPAVAPTAAGLGMDRLLKDLQLVMEGAYQPSHPGALAHLDPPPLTASIAADLICAGLNNNLLAEELSPGLTDLEQQLCSWFCQRLGLPDQSGGVLASGGTLSNLMGLVVARTHAGVRDGVVLCSRDAHVSLQKAATVMGLPDQALQQLPVDSDGGLDLAALDAALSALRRDGRCCLAVVATAGTTVRGAVDPLDAIARLCRRERVWLHVDAAIGGVFALWEPLAPLMEGLHQADSITLNPQKLLGITKTSSMLLLRDRSKLRDAFSTGLPYMESPCSVDHGGEVGLQGTRPAEVLKLWLGLRQLGIEGIGAVLESALERKAVLKRLLADDRLLVLDGGLHLLALRPRQDDPAGSASWTEQTRQLLMREGFLLSRPSYDGHYWLKVVLGNPHTTSSHLQQLAGLISQQLQLTH